MNRRLCWSRDGPTWPLRESSRFVLSGRLRWHVQQMGSGPVALLLHGTGASTHSWRGLMPLLASHCTTVAMDLPGHAFTGTPEGQRLSLPDMAAAVAALVRTLALEVDLLIGHSAGAAICARMVLDGAMTPRSIVAVNGAFLPLTGFAGMVFPPVAKVLAATALPSHWFAGRNWDRPAVERLIGGTGSKLDADGLACYARLVRDARHNAGALGMMAGWDLHPLRRDLRRLATPLALVVGARDRAVAPADALRVQALLPATTPSTLAVVEGGGHLVHEEDPAAVAKLVLQAYAKVQRPSMSGRAV